MEGPTARRLPGVVARFDSLPMEQSVNDYIPKNLASSTTFMRKFCSSGSKPLSFSRRLGSWTRRSRCHSVQTEGGEECRRDLRA